MKSLLGPFREGLSEGFGPCVDHAPKAGFGILQGHKTYVVHLQFPRIRDQDSHDIVFAVGCSESLLVFIIDEITDDEADGSTAIDGQEEFDGRSDVRAFPGIPDPGSLALEEVPDPQSRGRGLYLFALGEYLPHDTKGMLLSFAGWDVGGDLG